MGSSSTKLSKRERVAPEPSTCRTGPPMTPPKKKKKKLIPPLDVFEALDKHAIGAPESCCKSIPSLVQYLIQPANNDLKKVRVFYRWITNNIRHNKIGLINGNLGSQDPIFVLLSKYAVCEGFCRLFKALCDEVKIKCKVISGYSKGGDFNPGLEIHLEMKTNHAWNMVLIDQQWRLIDNTWGAGFCDRDAKFEKCFSEFCFLTDPEDFIKSHFPYMNNNTEESSVFQLLRSPITIEEFNEVLTPETKGLEWGYRAYQHDRQVLQVDKEMTIAFTASNVILKNISCNLRHRRTQETHPKYVLLRRQGRRGFTVKITPPVIGDYDLELYGQPEDESGSTHKGIVNYLLQCTSIAENIFPYPEHSGLWGVDPIININDYGIDAKIYSKDIVLAKKGKVEIPFKVKTEANLQVRVENDSGNMTDLGSLCMAYNKPGMFIVRLRLSLTGFYKLKLYADKLTEDSKHSLRTAEFLVECRNPCHDLLPYPIDFVVAGGTQKALDYGFASKIYSKYIYSTKNGEIQFKLKAKQMPEVKLKLITPSKTGIFKLAFAQYIGNTLQVSARFPEAGFYVLELYAKKPQEPDTSSFEMIAQFLAESRRSRTVKPFPVASTAAHKHKCVLREPLYSELSANQELRLRLRSDALKIVEVNGKVSQNAPKGEVNLMFKTAQVGDIITVFGKNNSEGKAMLLYEYIVV